MITIKLPMQFEVYTLTAIHRNDIYTKARGVDTNRCYTISAATQVSHENSSPLLATPTQHQLLTARGYIDYNQN